MVCWLLKRQKTASRSSRSQIKLELYKRRGATRIHIGRYSVSNIYKWPRLRDTSIYKAICWWYDTSLYIIVQNQESAALCLNLDLIKISSWAKLWLVSFNYLKNGSMVVSRKVNKPYQPPIYKENTEINEVSAHKHIGIFFSNDCSWHSHIDYMKEKAWKRINIMRKLKFVLDWKALETIYVSFIRPILEYGDTIWDICTQCEKRELDKIQQEAVQILTGAKALVSLQVLYNDVLWESLQERGMKHKLNVFFFFKCNMILSLVTYHHLFLHLSAKFPDIIYEMLTITLQYTVEHNNVIRRSFPQSCENGTIYSRKLNSLVP